MQNKKTLLLIPVAIIVVLLAVYLIFKPGTSAGTKEIEINVIDDNNEKSVYEIKTDAEYLRQALDDADGLTYSGDEGEFGLMITEINGVVADYNIDQSYWAFYVNGEYCNYGVDEQPVLDGDIFSIEYTK